MKKTIKFLILVAFIVIFGLSTVSCNLFNFADLVVLNDTSGRWIAITIGRDTDVGGPTVTRRFVASGETISADGLGNNTHYRIHVGGDSCS